MKSFRFATALTLGVFAWCAARAVAEENVWPFRVAQTDVAGDIVSWEAAGPLIFRKLSADGGAVSGFRPLFARWTGPLGEVRETDVVYPIFTYRTNGDAYRWSVFQLVNRSGSRTPHAAKGASQLEQENFDVWPFWFSRDTGTPESSYRGLFPIAGTIKNRFGYDRLSWTIFPLYGKAEKNGAITRVTPWPLIRTTHGTEHGFAFWPLFGWREKPDGFRREFYLWPLAWKNVVRAGADAPAGTPPRREVGFLPFFTRESGPGSINENFLWPFFGYTDRTQPERYHETRYFWPFLVQGHGADHMVDRYGPFYTHSIRKGMDKTWVLWPIYREKHATTGKLAQTQRQVFYFVYWSLAQRSATNPNVPAAEITHVWPLFSAWNNGAGRRQFQFPSPLEVFFPANERVHESWSPLLSLYRCDQRGVTHVRRELLWGFLTWRRDELHREFHLGPLLSVDTRPEGKRVAFGNGLVGLRTSAGHAGWRLFWFDFSGKATKLRASAR